MRHLIGKHLGPYEILSIIGQGGMATVYKAYQANMDRHVALKVLLTHLTDDEKFNQRFQQEVKLIAKLEHPSILPVYDFGETDGLTYLVMRLVEGGSLSDLLQQEKQLPLATVRKILSQIGSALDHSHLNRIIHRDIKPGNILIDSSDNYLLTDFGIAKIAEAKSEFTQTGHVIGTPSYISPELGSGDKVDHRSDIYSLGILLYQMLSGELPFHAETPLATVLMHIQDSPPSLLEKRAELPPNIEQVVLKAVAKDPDERYASSGELAEAFKQATTGRPNHPATEVIDIGKAEASHTGTMAMEQVTDEEPEEGEESIEQVAAEPETTEPESAEQKKSKPEKKRLFRKFHPKFLQFLFVLCVIIIFFPYNYYQTADLIGNGIQESGLPTYLDQKAHDLATQILEGTGDQSAPSLDPPRPNHRLQSTGRQKGSLQNSSLLPPIPTGAYVGGIISDQGNFQQFRKLDFTLSSSANTVSAHIINTNLIGLLLDDSSLTLPLRFADDQWKLRIPVSEGMTGNFFYQITFKLQGELLVGKVVVDPPDSSAILTGGHFVATRNLFFDFESYQPAADISGR